MKHIPNEVWDDFKKQYLSDDIKDIAQGLITTLILVIPEVKVDSFKNGKLYTKMREEYFDLVRQHTDIKISRPENITMSIETLEDFQDKCNGSWYNFFR